MKKLTYAAQVLLAERPSQPCARRHVGSPRQLTAPHPRSLMMRARSSENAACAYKPGRRDRVPLHPLARGPNRSGQVFLLPRVVASGLISSSRMTSRSSPWNLHRPNLLGADSSWSYKTIAGSPSFSPSLGTRPWWVHSGEERASAAVDSLPSRRFGLGLRSGTFTGVYRMDLVLPRAAGVAGCNGIARRNSRKPRVRKAP